MKNKILVALTCAAFALPSFADDAGATKTTTDNAGTTTTTERSKSVEHVPGGTDGAAGTVKGDIPTDPKTITRTKFKRTKKTHTKKAVKTQ